MGSASLKKGQRDMEDGEVRHIYRKKKKKKKEKNFKF